MPKYVIERQYLVPMYHIVVETENLEDRLQEGHQRRYRLGYPGDAIEVHSGLPPSVGQQHLDSPAQDPNAGVGDHHVQTPEMPFRGFDYLRPGLFERDVLMEEDRLTASTADLVHHRLSAGIVHVTTTLTPSCTSVAAQDAPLGDSTPVQKATLPST
jgi:hypothetical protein